MESQMTLVLLVLATVVGWCTAFLLWMSNSKNKDHLGYLRNTLRENIRSLRHHQRCAGGDAILRHTLFQNVDALEKVYGELEDADGLNWSSML